MSTITILLNGTPLTLPAHTTVALLLAQQAYPENSYAVALNQGFIARSTYASQSLAHNDVVDIITPMQGG